MRIANAIGFVMLVGFLGRLLGALEFHPLISAGLVLPILAVLVFENLWITGILHRIVVVRSAAIASLAVIAVLLSRIAAGGAGGLTPAESALGVFVAFLGVMALSAIGRPRPERFVQDA